MKKSILFFFLFCIMISGFAQQYKSHKVVKGENVYRIAKQYNTTAEAIYKINPNAKEGISEGQILAIPVTDNSEYITHVVEEGDTVYNLSKKYNTTTEAIYALNPEAVRGINLGQILLMGKKPEKKDNSIVNNPEFNNIDKAILDSLQPLPEIKKIIRFRTHKVRRKETLYSISRKYAITVDEIKKYNKRLYSEDIKKRDKIRIPVFEKGEAVAERTLISAEERLSRTTKYTIKPKDTKFGISRRHGITVEELETLNPGLDPDFPIGAEIIVPTSVFVPYDKNIVEPGFELYKIPAKETMFNLVRQLNISSDSLLKLNPYIREGLKEGMVITIPEKTNLDTSGIDFKEGTILKLEDKLYNFKPKKVAIMLPFGLDKIDLGERSEVEEFLKSRSSKGTKVALDFYKGALIAIDSAKTKGITTDVTIYDTQKNNNSEFINKIINRNSFEEVDVVIGPLYQKNVEAVAERLNNTNIPVVSPLSNKETKLYGNFFQTRPSDELLQNKLISFIKKDSLTDKNIVLIVQKGEKFNSVRDKLLAQFPEAKVATIEKGNYLYETSLEKVLDPKRPNWIILESDDVAMISNVTPMLNARAETHNITLFTTNKNKAFDDDNVKNEYLSKLHLHYPSIDKEYDSYSIGKDTTFIARYKKQYKTIPNEYAVRGFDITYDILMRLGTANDLYHAASVEGTTEYLENKFNYAKKPLGGYYNKASYIVRFDKDLKLSVVE